MKKILYFEACDFKEFPLGGTLSFAKQFINNIDAEFFLVGYGDENDPIGKWFVRNIDGRNYNYFAIALTSQIAGSKIPHRLKAFLFLKRRLKMIYKTSSDCDVVFSQSPEFVFAISNYKWKIFSFCFAGLGNSVSISRFYYLRMFAGIYERLLFRQLNNSCHLILAAADQYAINEKIDKFKLVKDRIKSFPTCFDSSVFRIKSKEQSRNIIGLELDAVLILTTGRLSNIKGWKDLIDSFRIFKQLHSESVLMFIGEGEERGNILDYAEQEINEGSIRLIGKKKQEELVDYLNAADVFAMFSYLEGWPTSMVEAIACGKNVVTTNVSASSELVIDGVNGYILKDRNINSFARCLSDVLELDNPNLVSIEISTKFSASRLNDKFNLLLSSIE